MDNFIGRLGELARVDMAESGVLASLTIAQGILESGWGKSELASQAKALFGIKATSAWTGETYAVETNECYDGVNLERVEAVFRAYDSWGESVKDHSALFSATRYAKVIGEKDYKKACRAVKEAGYATDPDYPTKLIDLIERYQLYEYDEIKEEEEMRFETVKDCPSWAHDTIQGMVDQGELSGNGTGLHLTEDMCRTFVIVENMLKRGGNVE
ncbi:MAG: glycoside hydrolase family 73 protein [Eubacteriales bacterium]